MKYLIKFLTINLFLLIFFNPLKADEKVVFLDLDFLLQNSNIGKKILKKISELDEKNINQLETKNKILKKLELDIKNKKNIISEESYNNEIKKFQKQIQNFNTEKNQIVNEFNNYRKLELENFFRLINPKINNYMSQNSISVVLDSKKIFIGNANSNITEDILEIINNEIK